MSAIADIRARAEAFTPGPWRQSETTWMSNARQDIHLLLAVAGAASALDAFLEDGFVTLQLPLVNDGAGSWVPAAPLLELEALGDALHEALAALEVAG